MRKSENETFAVIYDGSSVTSPKNWNNPQFGDPCYALHTDSRNYVVISIDGNGAHSPSMEKGFNKDSTMHTLNTIEQHSVCYAVENHPNDSRCRIDPDGIVQTLSSRMGTGGNNTPFVLIAVSENHDEHYSDYRTYAIDSHPMDSRIRIMEGPCPSITAKLAKLASDGPLVLIRREDV